MNKFYFGLLSLLFSSSVFAHGMSDEDKLKAVQASNWDFMELGASHMVTGYDHLLFLFGVIFFLTQFKDIVKFVTAFTIGHSITLLFATLYKLQINFFLIDAVIALTVIYKGFDNLDGFKKYLNVSSPNLLLMVFGFGLIHGFGLSTRLQMLPLPDDGLVLKILSFNLGVELGQIAALTVMLLLLAGWRRTASFRNFSKITNVSLMGAGFLLFLSQLHGYSHTRHPDEYPLNKDDHAHVHEDMKEAEITEPLETRLTKVSEAQIEPVAEPESKPVVDKPKPHSHGDGKPHQH